jgi:FtsH-binding integral membrane protein
MHGYENQQPSQWGQHHYRGGQVELEKGVGTFMNGVYAWMSGGIAVTAALCYGIATNEALVYTLFASPLRWVVLLAPLAMAWFLPARIPRMSRGNALLMFLLFSGLMGAAISYVPLVYQSTDIITAFAVTGGMFAGMAFIGYTTKKDLTGIGQFLVMALIGAVIASLVNVFLIGSVGMSLFISGIVAVVAAGLTAYHTQAIKQLYLTSGGGGNLAILGALMLYVDFINLFLSLLRLFGGGRD